MPVDRSFGCELNMDIGDNRQFAPAAMEGSKTGWGVRGSDIIQCVGKVDHLCGAKNGSKKTLGIFCKEKMS